MSKELNSYELSRNWFDFAFENPEKVSPNHVAIYFFAIEHCNRLGWRKKFGFPTQMAMDAIGIKKHQTYIRYFNDLVDWGFFKLIQKSQNQYSSNIISLISALPKNGKALDKAIINHRAKQTETIGQSNSSIDKQVNQLNNKPIKEKEEVKVRYSKFISEFNKITGSKSKGSDNDINNFSYWLKTYSAAEIIQAVKNHDETFWAEKINPQWLFRTKDTKGQPVDYIGQLLNHKKAKTIL